jgi:hypothetical protein
MAALRVCFSRAPVCLRLPPCPIRTTTCFPSFCICRTRRDLRATLATRIRWRPTSPTSASREVALFLISFFLFLPLCRESNLPWIWASYFQQPLQRWCESVVDGRLLVRCDECGHVFVVYLVLSRRDSHSAPRQSAEPTWIQSCNHQRVPCCDLAVGMCWRTCKGFFFFLFLSGLKIEFLQGISPSGFPTLPTTGLIRKVFRNWFACLRLNFWFSVLCLVWNQFIGWILQGY